MSHFYGFPLDLCGKCIAALLPNALQFSECAAFQGGREGGMDYRRVPIREIPLFSRCPIHKLSRYM